MMSWAFMVLINALLENFALGLEPVAQVIAGLARFTATLCNGVGSLCDFLVSRQNTEGRFRRAFWFQSSIQGTVCNGQFGCRTAGFRLRNE